ncbi:MAG TPA: hypothetical protein VM165_05045 [Planctomycetaceae bacterium]|nr:hypothetical protein [Planctomycetaceae bacterium]
MTVMVKALANPWIIRMTLLAHFAAVCVWGLWCRGYLPVREDSLFMYVAAIVLMVCPLIILALAVAVPGRNAFYAIIIEILLVYATVIALLPAVQ